MNAPVQIRTADAGPVPPPTPVKFTGIEQRVYAELARADGHYVTCADLVARVDGTFNAQRMRNLMRYVGNVRLALRGQTECTIVTAGTGPDLRYALIAVSAPADATARRRREVLAIAAPEGDQTRKGRITEALVAAGGRFLGVVELCGIGGLATDANGLARIRSLVNEVRSTLRTRSITGSILSHGVGETLAYAWSDAAEGAANAPTVSTESDPDAPRPTVRITLPPIGGRSCIFDGTSLVIDGVKQAPVPRGRA